MNDIKLNPQSRYLTHWRTYVYVNKLYSLPRGEVRGFRNLKTLNFSRDWNEMLRVLEFANRDLSILLFHKQTDLAKVRDTIMLNLLAGTKIRSFEFRIVLLPYLGSRTIHFVQELINYARSPYDDATTYELNVKYRSELPVDGAVLHNFMEFSKRVDADEYLSEPLYVKDVSIDFIKQIVLNNGEDADLLELAQSIESRNMLRSQTAQNEPTNMSQGAPFQPTPGGPRHAGVMMRSYSGRSISPYCPKRWSFKEEA